MTAPVGLVNRPAARESEAGAVGAGSVLRTAPTRLLLVPPEPPVPGLPMVAPVRRRVAAATAGKRAAVPALASQSSWWAHRVAAAAMTLAVGGGLGWIAQAPHLEIPADTAVIRVGAGETVWDVAQRVAPKSDQPAVVERIRQLNGMADSAIQPGQQLQVPDGR
jgi:LysM domain